MLSTFSPAQPVVLAELVAGLTWFTWLVGPSIYLIRGSTAVARSKSVATTGGLTMTRRVERPVEGRPCAGSPPCRRVES